MRSLLGFLLACIAVLFVLSKLGQQTSPSIRTAEPISPATAAGAQDKAIAPFIASVDNEYKWRSDTLPVDWPKFTVVPGKSAAPIKSTDQAISYALTIQQQWRDFKNRNRKSPPSAKDTALAIDYLLAIKRNDARFPEAWGAFIEARKVDRAVADYASDLKERKKRGVNVGMTAEEILQSSWGKPQKINETLTGRGRHEQWVYAGYNYLYVDDGVLTSIQTSR